TSALSSRGPGPFASTCRAWAGSCGNRARSRRSSTKSWHGVRRRNTPANGGGSIMLTGKLLRVRYARDRIIPCYLDVKETGWIEVVERLLEMLRTEKQRTRGELEEELDELFGDNTTTLVHQGLMKLLEDRCEFEVVSGHPPEQIREVVFRLAA